MVKVTIRKSRKRMERWIVRKRASKIRVLKNVEGKITPRLMEWFNLEKCTFERVVKNNIKIIMFFKSISI